MASSFLTILVPATLLIIGYVSLPAAAVATPPAPAAKVNLTGILEKGGQYQTLIRLLNTTGQVLTTLNNQLNNSDNKLTILAPSDNAFKNLPPDYLHNLNEQKQVTLLMYHVIPHYYTQTSLSTVENPQNTQSSGQFKGKFTLNFTGSDNQINVTSGISSSRVGYPLYDKSPLAVYPIDAVMMPLEFNQTVPAPAPSPSPAATVPSAPANSAAPHNKVITAVSWLGFLSIAILF